MDKEEWNEIKRQGNLVVQILPTLLLIVFFSILVPITTSIFKLFGFFKKENKHED